MSGHVNSSHGNASFGPDSLKRIATAVPRLAGEIVYDVLKYVPITWANRQGGVLDRSTDHLGYFARCPE